MSKPYIHAISSARKYGGVPEDYEPIHAFMDSSKGAIGDSRHRCLFHHAWALTNILERVKFPNSIESSDFRFPTIKNSAGRIVSVRDIGEQHILEDFGGQYIPTFQDYVEESPIQDWMNNGIGAPPPSAKKLNTKTKTRKIYFD